MDFLPSTVLGILQHNQCALPFSFLVNSFPASESKDVVGNVGPQKPAEYLPIPKRQCEETKTFTSRDISGGIRKDVTIRQSQQTEQNGFRARLLGRLFFFYHKSQQIDYLVLSHLFRIPHYFFFLSKVFV